MTLCHNCAQRDSSRKAFHDLIYNTRAGNYTCERCGARFVVCSSLDESGRPVEMRESVQPQPT